MLAHIAAKPTPALLYSAPDGTDREHEIPTMVVGSVKRLRSFGNRGTAVARRGLDLASYIASYPWREAFSIIDIG